MPFRNIWSRCSAMICYQLICRAHPKNFPTRKLPLKMPSSLLKMPSSLLKMPSSLYRCQAPFKDAKLPLRMPSSL